MKSRMGFLFFSLLSFALPLVGCKGAEIPKTEQKSWPVYLGNLGHNSSQKESFDLSKQIWFINADEIFVSPMCVFKAAVCDDENIYLSAQCCAACIRVRDNKPEKRWVLQPVTKDRFFLAAPCVSGGMVYFVQNDNWIICVKCTNGDIVWRQELPFGWGYVGENAPVAYNGVLYVQTSEALFALNCTDGSTRWKTRVGGYYRTSPVIIHEKQIIITGGGLTGGKKVIYDGVKILSLEKGEIKASIDVQGRFHTPVLDGNSVYLLARQGDYPELKATAVCVDLTENRVRWAHPLEGKATDISVSVAENVAIFATIKPATLWFLSKDNGQVVRKIELTKVDRFFGEGDPDSMGIVIGKKYFMYAPNPSLIDLTPENISTAPVITVPTLSSHGAYSGLLVFQRNVILVSYVSMVAVGPANK